jgi:hypothetical protein
MFSSAMLRMTVLSSIAADGKIMIPFFYPNKKAGTNPAFSNGSAQY